MGKLIEGYAQKSALTAADKLPAVDSANLAFGPQGTNVWATVAGLGIGLGLGASINGFGADPTGAAFSDAAMTAARALSPVVSITRPGTYKFAASYAFGPGQGLVAAVPGVILAYTGNGVFIYSGDPAFNNAETSPLVSLCGPQLGYIIDGTLAGAGAVGLRVGDQNSPMVNVGVRNFAGAGSVAGSVCNQYGYMNYGSVVIATDNSTIHIAFDNAGGGAAFGGVGYFFAQKVQPGQIGILARNGVQNVGGSLSLYGEYYGGSGANAGSIISIGPDGSVCNFRNMALNVNTETAAGAGAVGHTTMALGAHGAWMQNTGNLVFRAQGATLQPSTGTQVYTFTHFGYAESDAPGDYIGNPVLSGAAGLSSTVIGGQLMSAGGSDAANLYTGTGTQFQVQLAAGANTRAVYTLTPGRYQEWFVETKQPGSGGLATSFAITIAAGQGSGTVLSGGAGGGVVTPTATLGYVDEWRVWTPDGVNVRIAPAGAGLH